MLKRSLSADLYSNGSSGPLFAKAAKDYYEARAKEIDIAAGMEAIDVQSAN